MGNKIKSVPKPSYEERLAAARLAAAHAVPETPKPTAPPPLPKCDRSECPITNYHKAKQYKEGDKYTPKYITEKEERIKSRAGQGLPVHDEDKEFLNSWYAIHDTSRHLTMESIPRPVKCTDPNCPVEDYHVDKFYAEHAKDLPKIVKKKAARVYAAWRLGRSTEDWFDDKFLLQFFDVHGPKVDETATGPSAEEVNTVTNNQGEIKDAAQGKATAD